MGQFRDLPTARRYAFAVLLASITTILAAVMVLLLSPPSTYALIPVLIAGAVLTGAMIGLASKTSDETGETP